jgi:hypothetical protein
MYNLINLDEAKYELVASFRKVAALAGVLLPEDAIEISHWGTQHIVKPLSKDNMAIYVFVLNGRCLKVGKVGSKSQARYISHHYNPLSSKSNLAKSILEHRDDSNFSGVTEENVGEWIKKNVDRVNFILNKEAGISTLNLFESFLQCRLNPLFEGFQSQR